MTDICERCSGAKGGDPKPVAVVRGIGEIAVCSVCAREALDLQLDVLAIDNNRRRLAVRIKRSSAAFESDVAANLDQRN